MWQTASRKYTYRMGPPPQTPKPKPIPSCFTSPRSNRSLILSSISVDGRNPVALPKTTWEAMISWSRGNHQEPGLLFPRERWGARGCSSVRNGFRPSTVASYYPRRSKGRDFHFAFGGAAAACSPHTIPLTGKPGSIESVANSGVVLFKREASPFGDTTYFIQQAD